MTEDSQQNNINTSNLESLQHIRLSTTDKKRLRDNVEKHINQKTQSASNASFNHWLVSAVGRMAVGAAVTLFALGGLTYAAEDALPGSPLYAVKTNINEKFANLTAFSQSRAAQTQSKLAARRIDELQALLDQNKLNQHTSSDLLKDIADHTELARENITGLRTEGEATKQRADQLDSRLRAILAIKSQTLQQLAEKNTNSSASDIAQQAAKQLASIAQHTSAPTVGVANTASSSSRVSPRTALMNLLETATDQMSSTYDSYQAHNELNQRAPSQKLVTAAHALESAVDDIQNETYADAVSELDTVVAHSESAQRWVQSHPDITINTSTGTKSSSTKSSASSSPLQKTPERDTDNEKSSTTTVATITESRASSTKETKVTSQTGQPASQASVGPTKRSLHNETIKQAIKKARTLLSAHSQEETPKGSTKINTTASSTDTTSDKGEDASASTTASGTTSSPTSTPPQETDDSNP